MSKSFFRNTAVCLLLSAVCLCGCSGRTGTFDFVDLDQDEYFLCTDHGSRSGGILILDAGGNTVMQMDNAALELCLKPSGEKIPLTAGIIPRDSYLLITTHEGEDVPENYKTGMWSVSRNDWILSPETGFPATSMDDDYLCSFRVGQTDYNMDFKPYEPDSETYPLENGVVLHNQPENGNYYIADSEGNPYLTAQEYFQRNHVTADYLTDSLSVEKVIDGKYLIVQFFAGEYQPDGKILSTGVTRLCDLQGNELYPKWDYNYVIYATDQYQNINHRLLNFYDSKAGKDYYVDLDSMKELELLTGYEEIIYRTDALFLLRNGNEYTIYDASSQEKGAVFTSEETPYTIYVLGLNSYAIQGMSSSLITINGSETPVDSPETVFVTDCEYPVVTVGEVFGTSSGSYILDPEGSLVLKADQEILYADSSCYMYYNNDRFFIQAY